MSKNDESFNGRTSVAVTGDGHKLIHRIQKLVEGRTGFVPSKANVVTIALKYYLEKSFNETDNEQPKEE